MLADKKELEAILRHEEYHLTNRDTLSRFMAYLTQSLFPLFPVLADLTRNCTVEQEIQADREAIRGLGDDRPLIRVLRKLLKYDSYALCSVPAFNMQNTLEMRIAALVKKNVYSKKPNFIRSLVSILFLIVVGGLLVLPASADAKQNHTERADDCGRNQMCIVGCETHE